MTVSVEQAQLSLNELIQKTSQGESVVITQDQKPVAELRSLVPVENPAGNTRDRATLDLLAQWDREDQTDDIQEIARRNRDFEELKEGLNRNRTESGGPDARRVFP